MKKKDLNVCSKCGSENIDEYTVLHERHCIICENCGRKVISDTRKRAKEIWNGVETFR